MLFDCCKAAIPVCCRMLYFVMAATSLPISAARIPSDAADRFWTWLFMTLFAACNWFTLAPRVPRTPAMPAIASLIEVRAAWAAVALVRTALEISTAVVDPAMVPKCDLSTCPTTTFTEFVPAVVESLMKTVKDALEEKIA